MPNYEKQIEAIEETRRQIRITTSKQRKYELHRHLNKLIREYKRAKIYAAQSRKEKQ